MRKLLILCIGLLLLTTSQAHATSYPFSATITDTALTATMTGVPENSDQYRLEILTAPFAALALQNKQNTVSIGDTATLVKKSLGGTVSWSLSGLNPNNTYYLRASKIDGIAKGIDEPVTDVLVFKSGELVDITLTWPLVPQETSIDNIFVFKGQLDMTKNALINPDSNAYKAVLYISSSDFSSNTDTNANGAALIPSIKNTKDTSSIGINPDGTYYFVTGTLSPSTVYHFKQVVTVGNKTHVDTTTYSTRGGFVVDTAASQQAQIDSKTYRLLAPWPGLSVLMDPELCAQQKASGAVGPNAVCDVNGFLNFAFKTLIGLTAVVLVLRLMFEGYQYMVTDVPFLKANAKSGFMSALLGLLLALSSYVILNTINPKLVDNRINIDNVNVGVDGDTNSPTTFVTNGKIPNGVQCSKSGKSSSIALIAQSWVGKVTYTYGGKDPSVQTDGTSHLDCSAYVNTVLNCAGYTTPSDYTNSGTSDIFSNTKAEKINSVTDTTINGVVLKPGDLVGWKPGDHGDRYGHILIYIGNGQVMDSHGGNGHPVGKAIGITPITQLVDKIAYIRRI